MAMALIEAQNLRTPQKFNNFIGEKYELQLNQSIQNLLDTLQNPTSDVSDFTSIFHELLQAKVDPPIETIWVYSALAFRKSNTQNDETLVQFSAIKDLFQSITSCSASCSSSKSVALIAPVIHELCKIIVNLKVNEVGSKRGKKLMREIRSLVDVILGYSNVCICESARNDEGLIRPLLDLVSVWIGDKGGNSRLFFPLLSDEIIEGLNLEGCDVSELAGVVIAEAFLLRLSLEFREGVSRNELQKELRNWAVGSITGFQNFLFFETLVKMLLEPTLPVTSLLSSEDEIVLRKVLYDAVILPEYYFLDPGKMAHAPAKYIESLAMARLMVTNEAIELYRKIGDHSKAISYINAFSDSHLPRELIKWAKSEIGVGDRASGPNGSSPKAILKWLRNLEDQGIRSLDNYMSKYRARLAVDSMETEIEQPEFTGNRKKSDTDLVFYIDNKGSEDQHEDYADITNEPISDAFVAAAHSMQSAENDRKRKRKAGKVRKKKNVKFIKCNIDEHSGSSGEESGASGKDGSSSGSEVENPDSDDDSEASE